VSTRIQPDIGTDFVGYRIEGLIGRGGMGVVYRAYDLRLKRNVALKLVAPELVLDDAFRARFERETELAMALEHPNVVPIYDAGDVDGRLYMAMRLVEGSDLRAILRAETTLPPARAFDLCRQIGSALDAAHAKGLVHRDVKPSNVLVDADDHVYVADLGLSRRLDDQTATVSTDRSIGTPAYLAPEQIEGGPIDGRADVYALGCLFYECLTGEPPFTRDSRLALAWAHLEEEAVPPSVRTPGLSQRVDAVVAKALAKSPDDRYASCAAFTDDAQEALGLGPPRGSRRVVAALVVACLVVAAAVAFAFLRGHGTAAASEVKANTLVRIDPATNKVSDVIDVGHQPVATAVGPGSVWVYSQDTHSLAEIDPKSSATRRTIQVPTDPAYVGIPKGPLLAADAHGAWLVGLGRNGIGFLTNVRSGVPGYRRLRLDFEPWGVAAGVNAVWVVGQKGAGGELVRVDPRRLRVTGHRVLPHQVVLDNVTTGFGAVWGVDALREELYRIDPQRLSLSREIGTGTNPGRPWAGFGDVWLSFDGDGSQGFLVNPKYLTIDLNLTCCPPEDGSDTAAFGSTWTVNWPSGTVVRWDGQTKEPVGEIHITGAPQFGASCMTSIASGAGAVWVTVAPKPSSSSCPA
jgi:streptogramin lyase